MEYEGYWYLSRQSILDLFGDKVDAILQSFVLLKRELAVYSVKPTRAQKTVIVEQYTQEMQLALQIDAISQSSLELNLLEVSMYTVSNGNPTMRQGDIVNVEETDTGYTLTIVDQQDQEESLFMWSEEGLQVKDSQQGQDMWMWFSREPTIFFSDPELDIIEQLLL
jgi:ribosomal protein S17